MAIIIDTNCFSRVFCRNNKEHYEFEPVLNWIVVGNGFLVYGGSKYKEELKKARKFIPFINLLKVAKKVLVIDDDLVDRLQVEFENSIEDPDFDDPHLPAIVLASKCRLICSKDMRSVPFVTSRLLYPKGFKVPHYYSGLKDAKLLVDQNIDPRLKKHRNTLNKRQKEVIIKFVDSMMAKKDT